ncbi:Nif3-like dinuclear metal center hexameric protein [Hydrogenoanaerobacterium sp.]|uniref:Nif3-like dinuclear metal center hexameric protein n=1 Tax=Hydrogenoanaerobacterium sp. TaxID=2953763 RepID=UPI0028A02541|nr:Nif3-like dinuclear metal center hexameric protein [Hydrogenoanaerobacterium sp.]
MSTVRQIYECIDRFAPFCTAESWDNVGLLVEAKGAEVQKVLVALDITPDVAEEAREIGANLIISHHPVIFDPLRRITSDNVVYLLAKHDISAICAHTNLDVAQGGVNDILAQRLCLQNVQPLEPLDGNGLSLGRIGVLEEPMEAEQFLGKVKQKLGCNGLKYTQGRGKVGRVAVCGGAGANLLYRAAELGTDALVTADSKHNLLLDAKRLGIMLIDAGHYCTEQVVLEPLAKRLRQAFPALVVELSQREGDPVQYR